MVLMCFKNTVCSYMVLKCFKGVLMWFLNVHFKIVCSDVVLKCVCPDKVLKLF